LDFLRRSSQLADKIILCLVSLEQLGAEQRVLDVLVPQSTHYIEDFFVLGNTTKKERCGDWKICAPS